MTSRRVFSKEAICFDFLPKLSSILTQANSSKEMHHFDKKNNKSVETDLATFVMNRTIMSYINTSVSVCVCVCSYVFVCKY